MTTNSGLSKKHVAYSEANVRHNIGVLEYSRTCQSAASGSVAGILGVSALFGFAFYFICAALQSLLWYLKTNGNWRPYLPTFSMMMTHSLFGGLCTHVLFWTFLYGMVHVY